MNPTCGDEVTLRVRAGRRQVARRVVRRRWAARSARPRPACCTSWWWRRTSSEAMAVRRVRRAGARPGPGRAGRGRAGGRGRVRRGGKYPARVKCALLAWMAFKDAAARATAVSRTGGDGMSEEQRRDRWQGVGRRHRGGDEGRGRPGAGHQRGRPGPDLRHPRGRRQRGDPRHDAHLGGLPAHRCDRGAGAAALCTGPGGGLVKEVRINWVWMPPWGPDKITDEGREQLRALGFNV